jgi:formate-dependent nitrite reductase membrane component NrfD
LKRPERFLSILWRPNWSSWLARGAFVLVAFGGLGAVWLLAALAAPGWLAWLRWPLVAAAIAGAGYSGYLFAQAKGRDFWQSPVLPLHFVVQAAVAGLAVAALLVAAARAGLPAATGLATGAGATTDVGSFSALLATAVLVHLGIIVFGEIGVTHPTKDAQRAARALTRGSLRGWFVGAMATGAAAAALAVTAAIAGASPAGTTALAVGALAALAALWIWEHGWLRAGQCIPLS